MCAALGHRARDNRLPGSYSHRVCVRTCFVRECVCVHQSDLVPPHYFISNEAVQDKICIKSQVPRDCADDIQAYLRLFDTCPVAVRTEDPNFKAVSSMQTAADTCGAGTLVLGMITATIVALNTMAMVGRV